MDSEGVLGARALNADQDGQVLVVDLDQVGGVTRLRCRLGDHERDLLAGKTHALMRQCGTLGHQNTHPPASRRRRDRRQRLEAGVDDVGAGQHRQHAGRGFGGGGVDRFDNGMRAVGAAEGGIGLAVEIPVIGIAARAGNEPMVLAAAFVGIARIRHFLFAAHGFPPLRVLSNVWTAYMRIFRPKTRLDTPAPGAAGSSWTSSVRTCAAWGCTGLRRIRRRSA